jgi:outer membrane protein assembly factor BamB
MEWKLDRPIRAALVRDDSIFVSHPPTYTAAFDLNLRTLAWLNEGLSISTPMAADGEHLYVVSEGKVVALDSTSGEIEWRAHLPTEGPYHELAAVEEERMVLYSDIPWLTWEGSILYALDARSGSVLWQVDLPAPLDPYRPASESRQRHSAIAYDGGQVYLRLVTRPVCCFAILALDAGDGAQLWQFDFGIRQWPGESPSFGADALAFDDNFVYVPTYFGPLYAVHRFNGGLWGASREWRTSLIRVGDWIVSRAPNNEIEGFRLGDGVEGRTISVIEDLPFLPQIAALGNHLFVEMETYALDEVHIAVLDFTSGEQVGTIVPDRSDECSSVLLTMGACGNQLCLVTMNCIYQLAPASLP